MISGLAQLIADYREIAVKTDDLGDIKLHVGSRGSARHRAQVLYKYLDDGDPKCRDVVTTNCLLGWSI